MRSLLCSILLFSCFGFAQDLSQFESKRITFAAPANQLNLVLQQIGKSADVALSASPSMWQEYVFVKVTDVPLSDVMVRLADLCAGEWKQTSQGWVMSRSTIKAIAEERAENLEEVRSLKARIDKLVASVEQPMTPEEVEKTMQRMEAIQQKLSQANGYDESLYKESSRLTIQTPGERARIRLMQCLDLEAIASLKKGERIVFSTNPTRMQRPISSKARSILNEMLQEHMIWHEAAMRRPSGEDASEFGLPYSQVNFRKAWKSPPAKALVVATQNRDFMSSRPNVTLTIYDTNGRALFQSGGFDFYDRESTEQMDAFRSPPPPEKDDLPATFSKESQELIDLIMQFSMTPDPNRKLSDTWITRITNPDKYEPLCFVASEILTHIANYKKCNMIVAVPDSMYLPLFIMGGGKPTASTFIHTMKSVQRMEIVEKDGWFVAKPKASVESRNSRSDRLQSKKILQRIVEGQRITLDELADYAAFNDQPSEESTLLMSMFMLTINYPQIMTSLNSIFSQSNWNALRLFGRLSPTQRKHLLNGNSISYMAMSPPQRQAYFQLVYGAEGHLDIVGQNPNEVIAPPPSEVPASDDKSSPEQEIEYEPEYNQGSLENEPTEQLPNGIPSDAYLTISSQIEDVLFAKDSRRTQGMPEYPQDIDTIAWMIFSRERPDLFPQDHEQPNFDLFRVASQRLLHVKLHLTPRYETNEQLTEIGASDGKLVPFKDLPQAIRKRIEEAVAQHRKSYEGVKRDGESSAAPIPPGEKPPPGA